MRQVGWRVCERCLEEWVFVLGVEVFLSCGLSSFDLVNRVGGAFVSCGGGLLRVEDRLECRLRVFPCVRVQVRGRWVVQVYRLDRKSAFHL